TYFPYTLDLRNNLFQSGTLYLGHYASSGSWTIKDNLFDKVTLTQGTGTITNSNNGYDTTTTKLTGSSGGDLTVTNLDYQVGPLGNYYYPTTGGHLSRLLNAGSRSATGAGLYHYTTRIDAL